MSTSWFNFLRPRVPRRVSGNIMLALFAAIGAVGIVGATGMTVLKGPVRSMHNVTQKTIAENNMIASSKLAVMAAAGQADSGDCDADGMVEPLPWSTTGTGPFPTGGGYLPTNIGASLQDPWGNTYGYCVWDHGTAIQTTCPTPLLRLQGTAAGGPVIAVISSGADRTFQTSCANAPTYINRVAGSDDIILSHSYAEAIAASGGLWNLESGDPDTAQIGKNLAVKDSGGDVTFELDRETGIGDFVGLRTGSIAAKGAEPVMMAGGLKMDNEVNVTQCTLPQHAGILRYHSTQGLQVCNGTEWKSAGGSNPPLFQESTQGSSVALNISGVPSSDLVSMTVTTAGTYIILASGTTYAAQGYTYHASSCALLKNGVTISSSSNYDGITNGGSTGYIPHSIYDYKPLVAGDVLKISCSVSTNAPNSYGSGSRIQIMSLVSDEGSGGGSGSTGANLPNGTIVAFALDACPSGWSEYTPARGRFLRGRDPSGTIDPDGTRSAGSLQTDALQGHSHYGRATTQTTTTASSTLTDYWATGTASNTGAYTNSTAVEGMRDDGHGAPRTAIETRPKNVAITYCQYDGSGIGPNTDILDDLEDVVISSPQNGQVLSFNGTNWVNGAGNSQWITSGSDIYYNTGNVGIGTVSPQRSLDIQSSTFAIARTRSTGSTSFANFESRNDTNVGYDFATYGSTVASTLFNNPAANASVLYGTGSSLMMGTSGTTPFIFGTNATERMRISPTGNVGIGTNAPDVRFHTVLATSDNVSGSGIGGSYPIAKFTAVASSIPRGLEIGVPTGGVTSPVYLKVHGTSNRFSILNQYDSESFTIKDNGYVGIGASDPGVPLEVVSTDGVHTLRIRNSTSTTQWTDIIKRSTSFGSPSAFSIWSQNAGTYYHGMTVSPIGNIGFGNESPSFSAGFRGIQISDAGTTNKAAIRLTETSSALGNFEIRSAVTGSGNRLEFGEGADTFMTIRSDDDGGPTTTRGRVGIGTIYPSEKLHILNGRVLASNNDNIASGSFGHTWARAFLAQSGYIWSTTDSGNVADGNLYLHRHNTSQPYVYFGYGVNAIGSISTTGASVSYNTTSDYRLKDKVNPMSHGLDKVLALKPSRFIFKSDKKAEEVDGFIAHEVQEVLPYAVTGEKDAVEKDGMPKYQQLDYSKLTPILTAAIQDLKKLFDDLLAKVLSLTETVQTLKSENKAIHSEFDKQQEEIDLLKEQNKLLHERIDALEADKVSAQTP